MVRNPQKYAATPIGVVLRRSPGVTPWARWSWTAAGVLPGAGEADWVLLRDTAGVAEYHAGTLPLELHGADTDSYLHGLNAQVPCLYIIMRPTDDAARPFELTLVTASPFEAQDFADNGEDVIEKVAMPAEVMAWVAKFVEAHHVETAFKKRRRDRKDIGRVEDGVGDPRIAQMADVYRAPSTARKERLQ